MVDGVRSKTVSYGGVNMMLDDEDLERIERGDPFFSTYSGVMGICVIGMIVVFSILAIIR